MAHCCKSVEELGYSLQAQGQEIMEPMSEIKYCPTQLGEGKKYRLLFLVADADYSAELKNNQFRTRSPERIKSAPFGNSNNSFATRLIHAI